MYIGPCHLGPFHLRILSILRPAISGTTLILSILISLYFKTTFDLRPCFFFLAEWVVIKCSKATVYVYSVASSAAKIPLLIYRETEALPFLLVRHTRSCQACVKCCFFCFFYDCSSALLMRVLLIRIVNDCHNLCSPMFLQIAVYIQCC